jgi:hypothetical protein
MHQYGDWGKVGQDFFFLNPVYSNVIINNKHKGSVICFIWKYGQCHIQHAENEKTRLEHMQRERRKKKEPEESEYNPMWFK